MRIVSLVPSWTEYLIHLGVAEALVGRTKFCVRPHDLVRNIPHVGGTKSANLEAIAKLKPDLIIANREENDQGQVEACMGFSQVLLTDVRSIEDSINACLDIARAVECEEAGLQIIADIRSAWGTPRPVHATAAYVVWKEPMMVAGQDTFIHDVMQWWGIQNAGVKWNNGRYPQPPKDLWDHAPMDWVLLPSEPFPFGNKHLKHFQTDQRRALLVDGEAFSWYGSRMIHAAAYLKLLREQMLARRDQD